MSNWLLELPRIHLVEKFDKKNSTNAEGSITNYKTQFETKHLLPVYVGINHIIAVQSHVRFFNCSIVTLAAGEEPLDYIVPMNPSGVANSINRFLDMHHRNTLTEALIDAKHADC